MEGWVDAMLKDKRVDDFLDQVTSPPKAKPISSSQKNTKYLVR